MKKLRSYSIWRLLMAIALAFTFSWGTMREASASSNIPAAKTTTYDDGDAGWSYNGAWSEAKVRRVYGGRLHVSNVVGNEAVISITGSQFTLVFSKTINYGTVDVYVDGNKVGTIDQNQARVSHQTEWVSPKLDNGSHEIRFVHASGNTVNIDALKVRVPRRIPNPAPTAIDLGTPTAILPEPLTPTIQPSATELPTQTSVPGLTSTLPVESPTFTASPTAVIVASPTPTSIPSLVPSFTPTNVPTSTLKPTTTNTAVPTFTLTATNTPVPTFTSTATNTQLPTFPSTAIPTSSAGTRVYYVSVSGSDSNPGSQSQPWRSIQKAARTAIAGDTIYLRGGVYTETVNLSTSGTASQPIRFLAYPGETPVIDGNNYQLPTSYWGVLLEISGNYVQVSGIEVRYSNWMGVLLSGQHDLASNLNVHHSRETGILVSGDYRVVESSRVWQNANRNQTNSPYGGGGWATGLSAARHPNYAILRGNTIYNNWGEGLSTFEANGTVMEGNVVYDNWSANIYVSDATNVKVQRNLVYVSNNSVITSGSRVGIMMGDETYNPASSNITVINNLVYGAYRNFYWWQGGKGGGMVNVLIANNAFVNSRSQSDVQIDYGPHQNVRFFNNIVEQDDTLPVIGLDTANGVTFSHNAWSKKPSSMATGAGDVVGDPKLAKTGDFTAPGWYQLQATSPARNSAIQINEVAEDFFRTPRGQLPDIGAFESD